MEGQAIGPPVQSSYRCKWRLEDSEEDHISIIVEAAATIRQQTGIFELTRRSLLRRRRLCVAVGGLSFEHSLIN